MQTGPGRHTGPTAGGREATIGREGSLQQPNNKTDTEGPKHPQKGARQPPRATSNRAGRNTDTTKPQTLIPCHVEGEPHPWTRTTAPSFAAELDGHVLGTLCAVTMALLTNRLDLCIQGLFGAGKSKSMAILILALIEIDATDSLKILFVCKETRVLDPLPTFSYGSTPRRGCLAHREVGGGPRT